MHSKLVAGLLVLMVLPSLACSLTAEGGKICIVVAMETPGLPSPSTDSSPVPLPPETSPPPPDSCADGVPAHEAASFTGEVATVSGLIAGTSFRDDIAGQPTFLNFCRPYPNHCFTVVLWGENRQPIVDCLYGAPEDVLLRRDVCVTGLIEEYNGLPEIVLTSCDQLEVLP